MRKLGFVILGLALLIGAIAFGAKRHLTATQVTALRPSASQIGTAGTRSAASKPAPQSNLSGLQIFEMGLNVANVLVGILGIWMTMRGLSADRQAQTLALRRDR